MSDTTTTPSQSQSQSQDSSFEKWRKRISYMTNMGMTPEERSEFEKEIIRDRTDRECKRCEEYKNWMISYSMLLYFFIISLWLLLFQFIYSLKIF